MSGAALRARLEAAQVRRRVALDELGRAVERIEEDALRELAEQLDAESVALGAAAARTRARLERARNRLTAVRLTHLSRPLHPVALLATPVFIWGWVSLWSELGARPPSQLVCWLLLTLVTAEAFWFTKRARRRRPRRRS